MPVYTGGSGADTLVGSIGDDTITGAGGNDSLLGGDGADSFRVSGSSGFNSTSGYDTIDGGDGYDELRATAASTAFGIAQISNVELITSGGFSNVTIRGSTAGDSLDFTNVTLSGIKWIMLNQGNDTFAGSGAADTVYGDEGDDQLFGGDGDDTFRFYTATAGYDSIDGGIGYDKIEATGTGAVIGLHYLTSVELITTSLSGVTIVGSPLDDMIDFTDTTFVNISGLLKLGAGHDTLWGSAGDDYVQGGDGDDLIVGQGGHDVVSYANETAAVLIDLDQVTQALPGGEYDALFDIEGVVGSAYNDTLVGNAGDNSFGYTGYGGVSNWDSVSGYDVINGGDGNDEIRALSASTVIGLSSISNVEVITSNGFSNVTIRASTVADTLDFSNVTLSGIKWIMMGQGDDIAFGSVGADILYGDEGADSLSGGDGNDTFRFYTTTSGFDSIDGGNGIDRIEGSGSGASIGLRWVRNVEQIGTYGSVTGVTLKGSTLDDDWDLSGATITGAITGGIQLQDGADVLIATVNADLITGGGGADTLTGGAGADTFDYNALTESNSAARDVILDFTVASDKIDLSTLDASTTVSGNQAFAFLGTAAFTGVAGQLRLDTTILGKTIVLADVNGDAIADLEIELAGQPILGAGDFVL